MGKQWTNFFLIKSKTLFKKNILNCEIMWDMIDIVLISDVYQVYTLCVFHGRAWTKLNWMDNFQLCLITFADIVSIFEPLFDSM